MVLSISEASEQELLLFHSRRDSVLAHFYEPAPGVFIAESAKVTLRALEAGFRPVAMLVEEAQLEHDAKSLLSPLSRIPIYAASAKRFQEIAGYPMTRGVLCAFRRKSLPSPEELLASLSEKERCRIAVLEQVVNPANIGSIFRNAAALGIDAVLLSSGTCDPLSRRCLRVSMGTVFQIPWTKTKASEAAVHRTDENPISGLPGWQNMLHRLGYKTVAMALTDRSIPLTDPELQNTEKLAIVLGNEGDGLPPAIMHACDYTVCIPMQNEVDSLNVAAASAVAFWELC